ncbi:hypothetical protein [Propionibacterium freudenreichii]|uniref:hypothetical protein n=1 Tax=Propionibacterium freudenreichii TaxID=1744 RepID=UPI0038521816
MSARQVIAFCLDCWELHYGIPDSNGVYQSDSGSSNHWDHAVLVSLQAGLPISDGRADLFSLAIAVTALQPTNGREVAPPEPKEAA